MNEDGILTQEVYVLQDTKKSLGDRRHLLKERDINTENPLYCNEKLAVISSSGSENWYNWLLQVLPKLIISKEFKIFMIN